MIFLAGNVSARDFILSQCGIVALADSELLDLPADMNLTFPLWSRQASGHLATARVVRNAYERAPDGTVSAIFSGANELYALTYRHDSSVGFLHWVRGRYLRSCVCFERR